MSDLLVRYNDFSKGDSGWVDKARVGPGYFQGEQIVPYRDGSVGPRSGLLDLDNEAPPAGPLYDVGYVDMATGGTEYVWVHKGAKLARIPVYDGSGRVLTGQSFANVTGSFANQDPVTDSVEYDPNITYFTILHGRTYKCDWSAGANGTLTMFAGSPGGRCMEVFGKFLVLGGDQSHPNRIFYSEPGNHGVFPPANFVDVGPSGVGAPTIRAMKRLRDQLLVWTDLGQLFIITGTFGANEVIREFMPGDQMSGPASNKSIVRSRDGVVWWTRREEVPNLNDQTYNLPSAVPVSFTGGQRVERLDLGGYLRQDKFASNRESFTAGVAGRSERSLLLVDHSTGRVLLCRGDAWTRHQFADGNLLHVVAGSRGEMFAMNEDGAHLWAWLFELERPPWAFGGSGVEPLPWADTDSRL